MQEQLLKRILPFLRIFGMFSSAKFASRCVRLRFQIDTNNASIAKPRKRLMGEVRTVRERIVRVVLRRC
jgi:hypothetical protein